MKTVRSRIITLILTAVAAVTLCWNIFPCFIMPPEEATDFGGLIFRVIILLLVYEGAFYNKITKIASLCVLAAMLGITYVRFYAVAVEALQRNFTVISPYLFSLLTFGVSLLCFFCSRGRLGTILLFVTGIFTFFFQILTGYFVDLRLQIIFFAAVGVLFLHINYARNMDQYKSKSKWPILFVCMAAAICFLTLTGSEYLYNNSTVLSNMDTLPWDDLPKPLKDVLESSVYATGFSTYDAEKELGGALWYNYAVVLEVKTSRDFYLRGRIRNQYNGKNWLLDESDYDLSDQSTYWLNTYYYAVNREFFMERYFKDPVNAALTYFKNFDGGTVYQNMYIKYRSPYYNIFLPLNNLTYVEDYPYEANLSAMQQIKKGSTYDSTSVNVDIYSKRFQYVKDHYDEIYKDLVNEPRLTDVVRDMRKAQAQAIRDYTDLNNISKETIALAQEVTRDCKTDLEKIDAVKKYLSSNKDLIYKTSTVPSPENQDFVSNFLFVTKRGYCVHFASAAVAMLRAVGVPARYVEGFLSPERDGEYYRVSNKNSHSWVEAYTPLTGFITVEVTPGYERIPEGGYSSESSSSSSSSSSATPQPNISMDFTRSAPEESDSGFGKEILWIVEISMALIIAAMAVASLIKLVWRRIWFCYITKKDHRKAIIRIYDHFLRDLKILGLGRMVGETPYEYGDRVFTQMNFIQKGTLRVDFYEITRIAVKARYSENELTDEEYLQVLQMYRVFFPSCRRHFGRWRYILRFFLLS